jgi:hypothetical protein
VTPSGHTPVEGQVTTDLGEDSEPAPYPAAASGSWNRIGRSETTKSRSDDAWKTTSSSELRCAERPLSEHNHRGVAWSWPALRRSSPVSSWFD